eukprot:440843_1
MALKSATTETHKILDLSNIIDQLDDYKKGEVISFPFNVDDLNACVKFYPNGTKSKGVNGYCGIYVHVDNLDICKNDNRLVWCEMRCGEERISDQEYEFVNALTTGRGWFNAFTIDTIKRHKQIKISIELNHNTSAKSVKLSLFDQPKQIYKFCKLNGDITLIVTLNKNDNNSYSSPPHKKRKLNVKHNDNGDLEIKMSSIILRSTSKVFDRILSTNMREKQEKKK